jgi:CBS domain-containing protein
VVLLTEIVGRAVIDRAGRRGRLTDLAVDLFAGAYPTVTVLLVERRQPEQSCHLIPWADVHTFADPIVVEDLDAAPLQSDEALADCEVLKRDVLDALVLDLARERTVRVNDVWLRPDDPPDDGQDGGEAVIGGRDGTQPIVGGRDGGRLVVGGVDATPRAIVRRVSGRWPGSSLYGHRQPAQLIDWTDIELLRGDPHRTFPKPGLTPHVARLQPARIADLAEALPYMHAAELLNLLPVSLAADVFEVLEPARQGQVIGELDHERAVAILAEAAPDQVADVLGRLPLDDAKHFLESLPRQRARLVVDLLRYPADTAGGIMTNEVVTVPVGLTVAEAIEYIRPHLARPDLVYYVYAVDAAESRRLQGIVTLRDLLLARPEQQIAQLMNERLVTAMPIEAARDVAYRLADHRLNALPVVDDEGRLLGVVTVDNAITQIAPEAVRKSLPRVFA